MYDNYPEHDVPQQNIIQMFFAQRWSAILIEMALAIVISVAAGRAFDFFGPINAQTENPPQAAADILLNPIQAYEMNDIRDTYMYSGYIRQARRLPEGKFSVTADDALTPTTVFWGFARGTVSFSVTWTAGGPIYFATGDHMIWAMEL